MSFSKRYTEKLVLWEFSLLSMCVCWSYKVVLIFRIEVIKGVFLEELFFNFFRKSMSFRLFLFPVKFRNLLHDRNLFFYIDREYIYLSRENISLIKKATTSPHPPRKIQDFLWGWSNHFFFKTFRPTIQWHSMKTLFHLKNVKELKRNPWLPL